MLRTPGSLLWKKQFIVFYTKFQAHFISNHCLAVIFCDHGYSPMMSLKMSLKKNDNVFD